MKKSVITIIALAVTSVAAIAVTKMKALQAEHTHSPIDLGGRLDRFNTGHSGGLDKNGGHTDHKTGTYHYHR
jgi:hypothetical protein